MNLTYIMLVLLALLTACTEPEPDTQHIDRYALVTRNNVVLTAIDTLGALSVGNGEFAYTVDFTGLQSFPLHYGNGIALGTQSQWGWHTIPTTEGYKFDEVTVDYNSCNEHVASYPIQHKEGRAQQATNWLRSNPHRLHLGLIGLVIIKENGEEAEVVDFNPIRQELNLWTGSIESEFEVEGEKVQVTTYGHSDNDLVSARISSPLLLHEKLKIRFKFPYGKECHVCPGYDFNNDDQHKTEIIQQSQAGIQWKRTLDSTHYFVGANWDNGTSTLVGTHEYDVIPDNKDGVFEFSFSFAQNPQEIPTNDFNQTQQSSKTGWENFWSEGAAIDFSECTDPRAPELERRVILSQYLTKIQCAGSLPPQETGLTMNSWFGKFHLEMHWWHGAHFAQWDRINLLQKSLGWYTQVMDKAKSTAQRQHYQGARWQKMTDPVGNESPSDVGAFIIWQQPHPIYFSEQMYRANPSKSTLDKYSTIVFETADFMASFIQYDSTDQKYHLCQPIIPAQEIFPPSKTNDPPFEMAYWHFGLSVAQEWRTRMGLEKRKSWEAILQNLTPMPQHDGYYLPAGGVEEAYTNDEFRRDHPMVIGAYGMLPKSELFDSLTMLNTLNEVLHDWNWETTWGWDYPMLAMSATRLGQPEKAIESLFLEVQKNTYLVNGHNYQDKRLRLYLPGNGGILSAVALMAAGWEGCTIENPGFPKNGKWKVKWEGLKPML